MKQIDIYELDANERYHFHAEVENPLSHESLDCGYKRDRILLKNIKVYENGKYNLLNKGKTIRLDLGKQFKELNLKKRETISFDARVRYVPADFYFEKDKRGKKVYKVCKKCKTFWNEKHKCLEINLVRTLGFVSKVRKMASSNGR